MCLLGDQVVYIGSRCCRCTVLCVLPGALQVLQNPTSERWEKFSLYKIFKIILQWYCKMPFLSVTNTYGVHCENRSLIQSLALMHSATMLAYFVNAYLVPCLPHFEVHLRQLHIGLITSNCCFLQTHIYTYYSCKYGIVLLVVSIMNIVGSNITSDKYCYKFTWLFR